MFLCLTNAEPDVNLSLDKVDIEILENFREAKKQTLTKDKFTESNTDKATKIQSCNYKVKTRGIILAVYNWGIIAGVREMFGAESLSQVSQLYLNILDNIEYVI